MRILSIIRIVGLLIALFSSTMLLPALVAFGYRDGGGIEFVSAFAIALLLGGLLWLPNRHHKGEMTSREGFLIVVLFWAVLGSVGALPFLLGEVPDMSLSEAFFESFSGLTTTGATVLTGLDSLPKAFLFYRQLLQWLGGMGIIVLAVAVLPLLGIGGDAVVSCRDPRAGKGQQGDTTDCRDGQGALVYLPGDHSGVCLGVLGCGHDVV